MNDKIKEGLRFAIESIYSVGIMKRFIVILIAILSLSSCQDMYNEISDIYYWQTYSDLELYYGDFSKVHSELYISYWISNHVKYDKSDKVLSPRDILERGTGDCNDYAILYINIMYVKFGKKCSLCLVDTSRNIIEGGKVNHAVIRLPDGILIEPQTGFVSNKRVGYEYPFDSVFKESTDEKQ